MNKWKNKYTNKKGNAKKKGIPFLLSFEEYMELVAEAGLIDPEQIGISIDSYHLSRYGDVGPYEIGNCRFIPHRENLKEKIINGGTERAANKNRGKTKDTHDSVKTISLKASQRTKENDAGRISQAEKLSAMKRGIPLVKKATDNAAEKHRKCYEIVSPEGVRYIGKGLRDFCVEHGLGIASMQKLCRGEIQSFKGWTGKYLPETQGITNE